MKTSLRLAPHSEQNLRVWGPPPERISLKQDELQNSTDSPTRKQSSPRQATPLPTLYPIMQALPRPMALSGSAEPEGERQLVGGGCAHAHRPSRASGGHETMAIKAAAITAYSTDRQT